MEAFMNAKLVLVTGATDGIGRETARQLAARGVEVILHGRDPARLEAAVAAVAAAVPGATLHTARGDLSRLDDVRALAADLVARFPRLDALIHNAGIFAQARALTVDGFESTLAVNHLAPFVLTHLTLGPLRAARGRVVTVSSVAHQRGELDLDDLAHARGFSGYAAYARSKLCNVLFAAEMARRLGDAVTSNSLHPGVVSTKLLATGFGMQGNDSLAEGAATSVFLALDPSVGTHTGKYFAKCRATTPSARGRDGALAAALYEASAALTGITPLPIPAG
jgi:NAD(P)-dependent dehydrogenase (short-subunit alcohol dehydrogenase family)